jgi:hypothetical protein
MNNIPVSSPRYTTPNYDCGTHDKYFVFEGNIHRERNSVLSCFVRFLHCYCVAFTLFYVSLLCMSILGVRYTGNILVKILLLLCYTVTPFLRYFSYTVNHLDCLLSYPGFYVKTNYL